MEWLFRRHFWIVHVVGGLLAAFLVAIPINSVVGYFFGKRLAEQALIKPPVRTQVAQRNFGIANERNLFGAKREVIAPVEGDGSASDRDCVNFTEAPQSNARARLVGTTVFSEPSDSMASVEDLRRAGVGAQSFSINDCPDDYVIDPTLMDILGPDSVHPQAACNKLWDLGTIKRIDATRIYFYNASERRCEYLALENSDAPPLVQPVASQPSFPGPGADYGKSIRKTGPKSYEIDAADLDAALNNLSQISTQARMVPAFEEGKPVGFKFFSIRPNSVFSRLGFENGDIIKSINGYELNSPDKALELWPKLKTDKQYSIDIKKGTSNVTYDYKVVGGR